MSETLSRERLEEALAECAVDNPASSDDLGDHIAALEAENERLEAAYMDMGARAAGFEYTVRHLEEENAELRAELKRTDEMFARVAADEQLYRERLAVVATERDALESSQEALRDVVEWQCRTKCAGYSSECTDRCRAAQVFRARELSR